MSTKTALLLGGLFLFSLHRKSLKVSGAEDRHVVVKNPAAKAK
jgi:hypothetical protein